MREKRILVLAPHADDEVLGCGGLIARRRAAGAWVHVAACGVGGVQQRGGAGETQVAERRAELEQAAAVLDVNRVSVLYPGLEMRMDALPMLDMVTAFDGLLDEAEYDEVYLPYASINHDHQIVYRAMLAALRPTSGRRMPRLVAAYEYALIGWQLEAVPGGRMYVDVVDVVDRKLEALHAYKSQMRPAPHPCSDVAVVTLAAMRGMEVGLAAAEMFYVLRMVER